ncbi:hypothetical protein EJP67_18505 [Variovorax guangxiensis]|uniref:DnaT DNA-binding domain-containing protein n=1 Tax=Variovorax guangxiensis TaxID=1775474 RepID=A0A3S0ZPT3_9BURK|nr:hypothetical protein [Variovorax guangxiensis]RUR69053.1 hypothetical protein EJP67_18505 [Variovorax guangxiensis]
MARIRTIKPEFPHSESMGRVSRESRLCFILLWTIADDAGRLRGNSRMLASLLYPYDDDAKKHIDGWLDQLSSEGCVARYEVDGTAYLQILNWASHQKIDKPSPSKLPAFVESSRKLANPREPSALDQEGNGEEGSGSGDSAPPQCVEPPTLTLTLNDKSEHPVYPASIVEWQATYPGVNVPQQLREMKAWCTANPTNRKTKRGIEAFIVRWLSKEQDKSGQQPRFSSPVGVTVPGREGRDPALLKIEEDSKKAAPVPANILEKLHVLKGNGVSA